MSSDAARSIGEPDKYIAKSDYEIARDAGINCPLEPYCGVRIGSDVRVRRQFPPHYVQHWSLDLAPSHSGSGRPFLREEEEGRQAKGSTLASLTGLT